MDRFIKQLSILIIMLFILATGINATLDHLAACSQGGQFATARVGNGAVVIYSGDLNRFADAIKVDQRQMPKFLRRVRLPAVTTISADQG